MKCLNCGHECQSKFCPDCGQPTSTTRTSWKSFSIGSVADMLRFRGPFIHTCLELIRCPWKVIEDYKEGRRVRYTSPLLLLLTLGIYSSLLSFWILGDSPEDDEVSLIVNLFNFSHGMGVAVMLPPIVLALKIAFRKTEISRYNMPELIIAGIFLSSTLFIVDIVSIPFDLISPVIDDYLTFFGILYCSVAILMIAKTKTWIRAVWNYIKFVILGFLFIILYDLIIESVYLLLIYLPTHPHASPVSCVI